MEARAGASAHVPHRVRAGHRNEADLQLRIGTLRLPAGEPGRHEERIPVQRSIGQSGHRPLCARNDHGLQRQRGPRQRRHDLADCLLRSRGGWQQQRPGRRVSRHVGGGRTDHGRLERKSPQSRSGDARLGDSQIVHLQRGSGACGPSQLFRETREESRTEDECRCGDQNESESTLCYQWRHRIFCERVGEEGRCESSDAGVCRSIGLCLW
mmetsp:Transcript_10315/g.18781  ORF Transcript_10315/g.18781 Transcript_10315/m.18781 type:complete len:211 (-) Transcript_10315:285-917(-)